MHNQQTISVYSLYQLLKMSCIILKLLIQTKHSFHPRKDFLNSQTL